MTSPTSRIAGLDTLRAAAIALVFMYHYQVFVSGVPTFGWASEVGWVGVDLFFVLSGYLIANPLFAGLARGDSVSPGRFYARRALRTLPLFWLVLAAYLLFPSALGGRTPPAAWRFLTFTQNLGLSPGTAFSHAWSLCIEEQFYLALPLVLAAGAALRCGRASGWLALAALTALGIGVRVARWRAFGGSGHEQEYMRHVYYATACRFDEFLPGIAVAMIKHFHRPAWERLMSRGGRVLAAGVAATTVMCVLAARAYYTDGTGYGFFMTAFGYSLLALSFALLVVAALSPASLLHRVHVPGARRLALWSYAIYLSHKPLAHVIDVALKPYAVGGGVRLWAITAACIVVGAALHRFVEAPFLALRDRLVPSNFRREQPVRGPAGADSANPLSP